MSTTPPTPSDGSRRRLLLAGSGVLVLAIAAVGTTVAIVSSGHKPPPTTTTTSAPPSTTTTSTTTTAAAACPLTGQAPAGGSVPQRPAIAVKVDNYPTARPQAGLDHTDIVFEEPVEGGITRLVAVFQCQSASRIEPVRSSRLIDPFILDQLSHPIFGYAGGINPSLAAIAAANVFNADFSMYPSAYQRNPARSAPHNLYTSTSALYGLDPSDTTPPAPIFSYSASPPASSAPTATTVHIPFSNYSDVYWTYSASTHSYLRSYSGGPTALTSAGRPISASNVVVIKAIETITPYVEDATGSHEVMLTLIGSGTAYVFRNGKAIPATWTRPSKNVPATLQAAGHTVALAPGRTWVELVPSTIPVTYGP